MRPRWLTATTALTLATCQAPPMVAVTPPVVTTQYELRADERTELCTLTVREVQPFSGGPARFRQLAMAFGRNGAVSALVLQLVRSDVSTVNGAGIALPWRLVGTVFVLGDWSSAATRDQVAAPAGTVKQFVVRDRAALDAFDRALTASSITVSYRNAASGQAEAWTLPPLAGPANHGHLEAFRDCVARIGGPAAQPGPTLPPAAMHQT